MAESDSFNLISVGSDDDDEIVIQAGSKRHASQGTSPRSDVLPEDAGADYQDAPVDEEPVPQGSPQGEAETLEEDPLAGLTEEERHEYTRRMARKRKREEEAMQTTQSDLHAEGPFTGMHLAIILIGVIIVVAGLAWYFIVYAA